MNPINKVAFELLVAMSLSFSAETGLPQFDRAELNCLAQNIYFEARAESMQGKMAVANVTKNRLESEEFPNTWCGVVKQGPVRESWKTKKDKTLPKDQRKYFPIKHRCQFSWWCDGEKDTIWIQYMNGTPIESNKTAWRDSINVALLTMTGHMTDNTKGSTYYYNHNLVYPNWAKKFDLVGVIGNHTFMKEEK